MNDIGQDKPESAAMSEPEVKTVEGPGVADPVAEYAIVEIFGHRRHVGRVEEVERYGAKLLRVDVPTDGDFENGFVSHFYGGAAIFGITPTDLDTVQRTNKPRAPIGTYRLPPPDDDDPDGDEELCP